MIRFHNSPHTGEQAICGDYKVSRGLFGNRITMYRFDVWETHADGSRTGVWMIVEGRKA
jgi:hypothetical protein